MKASLRCGYLVQSARAWSSSDELIFLRRAMIQTSAGTVWSFLMERARCVSVVKQKQREIVFSLMSGGMCVEASVRTSLVRNVSVSHWTSGACGSPTIRVVGASLSISVVRYIVMSVTKTSCSLAPKRRIGHSRGIVSIV